MTISVLAQNSAGKLFLYTQKSAPNETDKLAFVEYPSVQYTIVDSTSMTDFIILGNRIYVADENIYLYDLTSLLKLDSIMNTHAQKLCNWNDKLVITSSSPPYLRGYDISNNYSLDFVIDTPKIVMMPMDIIVSGDWAILTIDTSIMIIDLLVEDTLACIGINAPLQWAGYSSSLIEANNAVYIDLEYWTGAPRFSFVKLDKVNFKTDSVFHVEMNMNVYKPLAVNERIYLTEYPSYYDTNTDSLFLYGFYSPFAIEHDSSTACIFVYDDISGEILCYDDTVAISNIMVQGYLKKALWHPQITSSILSGDMDAEFSIYPSPCKNELNIDFADKKSPRNISIYNIRGERVFYESFNNEHSGLKLNVKNYKTGLYFIEIETIEGKFSEKILKIR